jgi:hypothetical protein
MAGHFGMFGEVALIVIPARVAAARVESRDSESGILRAPGKRTRENDNSQASDKQSD